MATRDEISFSVWDTARPHITDDDITDIREVKSWVDMYRVKFLEQQFAKNPKYIDKSTVQNLESVGLELVDSSEDTTYETGYIMLRTVSEIPNTIKRPNYEGTFVRIGPSDKTAEAFNLVTQERAIHSGNMRFNSDRIYAFLLDNKIYLYSKANYMWKGIKYINVQGVFQDPTAVWEFTDSSTYTTFDATKRYPVSEGMRVDIEKAILQEKFGIILKAPIDDINSASNDINPKSSDAKEQE